MRSTRYRIPRKFDVAHGKGYAIVGLIWVMGCLVVAGVLWMKALSMDEPTSAPVPMTAGYWTFGSGVGLQTKNIEDVKAGEKVWAYDTVRNQWKAEPVLRPLVHDYAGDMVTISIAGQTITSTGNHPYWVAGGDGLFDRKQAKDVYPSDRTSAVASGKGRWIEARSLQAGDMLVLRDGSRCPISEVQVSYAKQKVYNLQVADLHTYAVSDLGVAVHNKPCFPPGTLILMGDGSVRPIEQIELGDQVMAGDPLATGPPHAAKVTGIIRDFTDCLVNVRFRTPAGTVATITPTQYHPFWTVNRAWVEAKDLAVGDQLQESRRQSVIITDLSIRPKVSRTYNFEVQGLHTYYALANDGTSILVHNQVMPALPYYPPAGLLGNTPPTFYHYGYLSDWNAGLFNNGLRPGASVTQLGDLTGAQAYDGLGLGHHPTPPDTCFTVTPDRPITLYGPADPAGATTGGLPEYRAPLGTGPGTVGSPTSLVAPS